MTVKSKTAMEESIRGLCSSGRSYLWTFTLPVTMELAQAATAWSVLHADLRKRLGVAWAGVRVFEVHPGGHGLHVHVVTRFRFNVRAVRRVCEDNGWGRVHVALIRGGKSAERVGAYLSKYLSKSAKFALPKGCRTWAAFGRRWEERVRVKDVKIDSLRGALFGLIGSGALLASGLLGPTLTHAQRNLAKMRIAGWVYAGVREYRGYDLGQYWDAVASRYITESGDA